MLGRTCVGVLLVSPFPCLQEVVRNNLLLASGIDHPLRHRRTRWSSCCATRPDGGYHGNFGHQTSVIVDYPFITGRSTPDSVLTGQKMIDVLDGNPPLRRWG